MDTESGGAGVSLKSTKARKTAEICDRFVELGWRKRFVRSFFRRIADESFNKETVDYWVETYIGTFYAKAIEKEYISLKDLFYEMGLKKSIANRVWKAIKPLCDTCYTDEQLVELAVQYLLGNVSPLVGSSIPYFLTIPNENEWVYDEGYGGYMLNYDTETDVHRLIDVLQTKTNSSNKYFLFHCTCWRYAIEIAKHGPDHSIGRRCLDFGIRSGFYTTKDVSMALDWGQKKNAYWGNEVAVLVYKVSMETINKRYKTRIFKRASRDWKRLVSNSRECVGKKNELDCYDFVEGPVCKNPRDVAKKLSQPIAYDMTQFVSKSDNGDDYLSHNFVGIIWCKKI